MKTWTMLTAMLALIASFTLPNYQSKKHVVTTENLNVHFLEDTTIFSPVPTNCYTQYEFEKKVIKPISKDYTYKGIVLNKPLTNNINMWYTAFITDSVYTLVINRKELTIDTIIPSRFAKKGESQKQIDRAIIDSLHTANGIDMPNSKKKWTYSIITGRKARTKRALERGAPLLEIMVNRFQQDTLPIALAAKPFFESEFVAEAHSWAGAQGIFQFTKSTGKLYGLRIVKKYLDERRSFEHSLNAYIALMTNLFEYFEERKLLATVAYNTGEGHRYMKNWERREELEVISKMGFAPRNYIGQLIASQKVIENMFEIYPKIELKKYNLTDTVLTERVQGKDIENYLGISKKDIQKYNPQFEDNIFKRGYFREGTRIFLEKE